MWVKEGEGEAGYGVPGGPGRTDPLLNDYPEATMSDEPPPLEREGSEAGHMGAEGRASSWWHAAFIVVGEIIGTGVMGLPAALASLGMGVGIAASVFFAWCSYYSGTVVSRSLYAN